MSEELDLCLKRVTINSRNNVGVPHLQDFTINTINLLHGLVCISFNG